MKSELEAKLGEEFPFMRMGKTVHEQIEEYGKIKDLYGAFGCSCGDGWYELLRSMCELNQRWCSCCPSKLTAQMKA